MWLASLGVVAMLAMMAAVVWTPGAAQAQDGPTNPFGTPPPTQGTPTPTPGNGNGNGDGTMMPDPGDMIDNSSTSASATVELQLTIANLPEAAVAGSSVELYLEDDFQVPDSIDRDTVYFRVTNRSDANVNGGGRVYATDPIEIDDDDHYGGDDDWSIRVFIPDMNDAEDSGFNGPAMGDTLTLVFTKAAGIKNPSEAGTHSVGYSVLGSDDDANDGPDVQLGTVATVAKISLSDEDNDRGYELTVTGSGFNNGTSAAVHVLNDADATPDDKTTWPSCAEVITKGARAGIATVGSDDKVAVTFAVTVPTFKAGKNNYICMVDGEGRSSSTDVEQFELQDSLRVVPATANAGDTVNVFAQDFPVAGAALAELKIAGQVVWPESAAGSNFVSLSSIDAIGRDGSATLSFELPGSISGSALEGTVRIDAKWGETSEDSKITIAGSQLTLSKSEVSANESVTIRGSGFGAGAGCLVSATLSGADLMLVSDDDIGDCDGIDVEVSSAGQFAATVAIWVEGSGNNPALTPGTHTIEVVDDEGFTGNATIIIKEPTLTVTPDVAGPRDYVTISGENWPAANEDGGSIETVKINIDEGGINDDEDAYSDAIGRWSVTYRVAGDVVIPSTVPVKATYGSGNEIVRVASFSVTDTPSSQPVRTQLAAPANLVVVPGAQSGTVNLRWDAPANAQYHFVAWIPAGTADLNRASILPFSAEGMATISGLNPGAMYNFIVIAGRWEWSPVYGPKWSEWSGWVSVAVP